MLAVAGVVALPARPHPLAAVRVTLAVPGAPPFPAPAARLAVPGAPPFPAPAARLAVLGAHLAITIH